MVDLGINYIAILNKRCFLLIYDSVSVMLLGFSVQVFLKKINENKFYSSYSERL